MRASRQHVIACLGALMGANAAAQPCAWEPLGAGLASGGTLAAFDDGAGPALYVHGFFSTAGGQPARNVARWDGKAWSQVGDGLSGIGGPLAVFDDGSGPALYAAGAVVVPGSHIARWDGVEWSIPGAGIAPLGFPYGVFTLAGFDDEFTSIGGVPAVNIARITASGFEPLGVGIEGIGAGSMAQLDDGSGPALYVSGGITHAGGVPANNIARWKCNTCYPDCDPSTGQGVLDIFDVLCFQDAFTAMDPYADCDRNSAFDIFDFLCFQDAFVTGCQ